MMHTVVPWTDEERAQLRRLRENGLSCLAIGRLLGRSKHSVHRQLLQMRLLPSQRQRLPAPAEPVRERRFGPHVVPKVTLPPLPSLMMDEGQ